MSGSPQDAGRRLEAARAGSQEALGESLEACRRYLLGVADRELDPRLRPKGGASDLVQETFLEAQRDFARFRGTNDAELRAWLRRLLLNNVANFARGYRDTDKRQIDREVALDAGPSSANPAARLAGEVLSPSGQAMAAEEAQALQRALDRLPDDLRQIIQWRYREERTFDEIAALLNCSAKAARKLWGRAVERLQQELDAPP